MLAASIDLQNTRIAEYFATGEQPAPLGSKGRMFAPDAAFACADRKYIAVSATTDAPWRGLCQAMGLTALTHDPRFSNHQGRLDNSGALTDLLQAQFLAKPLTWWLLRLQRNGVPRSAAFDYQAIRDSAQVAANGFLQQLDTPHWGQVLVEGMPWQFDKTPAGPHRSGGLKGEHTAEVLAEQGARA